MKRNDDGTVSFRWCEMNFGLSDEEGLDRNDIDTVMTAFQHPDFRALLAEAITAIDGCPLKTLGSKYRFKGQ